MFSLQVCGTSKCRSVFHYSLLYRYVNLLSAGTRFYHLDLIVPSMVLGVKPKLNQDLWEKGRKGGRREEIQNSWLFSVINMLKEIFRGHLLVSRVAPLSDEVLLGLTVIHTHTHTQPQLHL